MKIEVGEKQEIILKEVYSGVTLVSGEGEKLGICMRDSGFEFTYEGLSFSAQEGVVTGLTRAEASVSMPSTPVPEDPQSPFTWDVPVAPPREVSDGDVRLVTIETQAVFRFTDKLVSEVDEDGNAIEYTSGWLMHIPEQTIVYRGQESTFIATAMPN